MFRSEKLPIYRLMSELKYDAVKGTFSWLHGKSGRRRNKVGSVEPDGYIRVLINGCRFPLHILAYALTYGFYPQGPLDHIDGERGNNRISNLRLSSFRENQQNRSEHRSGRLVGTTYNPKDSSRKKWTAQISLNGRGTRRIGRFHTEQEAHEAYKRALEPSAG